MTKALDSALAMLTRREHGAMELYHKLKQKGFSQTEAQAAVDKCQELGLQSDSRFVASFGRSRISQGYGPIKIRQELKDKGIDSDLIQSELQHEQDNWLRYALDVWKKKCRGQADLSYIELQKQQRFLFYRGFGPDVIAAVVKEMKIEGK
jgi:regulatory protein